MSVSFGGRNQRLDQTRGTGSKLQQNPKPSEKERENIWWLKFSEISAPGHCEIWRAAKDSFKNRTNYVN